MERVWGAELDWQEEVPEAMSRDLVEILPSFPQARGLPPLPSCPAFLPWVYCVPLHSASGGTS